MTRHDESLLWQYAASELEADEARVLEDHLGDCPECREKLAAVQVAREALEAAREAQPAVRWPAVDEVVGAEVERRLQAQARGPWLRRLGLGAGLLAAAAGLALLAWSRGAGAPPAPPPPELAEALPVPAALARVDRAWGLERLGGGALADGEALEQGAVLATSRAGRAFVHLPEQSHVRLGAATQLTLSRVSADEVALSLERGRLAVGASHQERKGFVVLAGALAVHVVGTVFAVAQGPAGTEVAVAEGRVRVDLPEGEPAWLGAGQRLRADARGRVQARLPLTPAFARELQEVSAVADTTLAVESRASAPAVGGRPTAPPLVASPPPSRALPRLDPARARARQGTLPPEALGGGLSAEDLAALPPAAPEGTTRRLEPRTEVVVEEPGTTWPSMAGVPGTRPAPRPAPQAEPAPPLVLVEAAPERPGAREEWARMPEAAPPAPRGPPAAPPPATVAAGRPLATDLESRFMEHAEAAVEKGECERYQAGLEDIAQDGVRTPRTELARVLRARCLTQQLRPRQAMNEYRKYLQEYPAGRFVQEAREALGP